MGIPEALERILSKNARFFEQKYFFRCEIFIKTKKYIHKSCRY